ncbi:MAG: dihydroneopterin aldolase [Bacteroidetes bacterium]|nr:dihydroneopterin aldolase [Bacteroidota bacterium]MBS1631830.1 dihydroneopterin aldolase [Bacteroidota bacterium]
MITIQLNRLHFFAYHGLYPEEKKIGAEFDVNLLVSFQPTSVVAELHETINYEKLYFLLKEEMNNPRELLETFVMETAGKIQKTFPYIKKIEISITKLQVPIAGFAGTVSAVFSKEF